MPKVTEQHQESRRLQIIEAAVKCFSQKGFHKTTMQDIIIESGLSSGAIYLYFKSKTDIIKVIAEMRHKREKKLFDEALKKGELKDILPFLVDRFISDLMNSETKRDRLIGVQMWAEALNNPEILSSVKEGIDEPIIFLRKLISKGQAEGKLSKVLSSEAVARSMIALFHGFILQMAWDDHVNINELREVMLTTIDLLLDSKSK